MTDKEKLKEIKKLADAMYYAAFNLTTDASLLRKAMKEYHQFIIHEYCKEEPVASKVFEDMLNAKTPAESLGISQEKHDRIVDELIYGKEPELVDVDDLPNKKEEPVSDDTMTIRKEWFEQCKKSWYNEGYLDGKHNRDGQFGEPVSDECIYNRTLEERQRSCKFCSAACQMRIKEEPVSEELDDAAFDYAEACKYEGGEKLLCVEHFKAGAKWKKQQDQETIELAEDHAYFAGRTKTMDETKEALLSEVLPCFMHGGEADEVVAKLEEVLNKKK